MKLSALCIACCTMLILISSCGEEASTSTNNDSAATSSSDFSAVQHVVLSSKPDSVGTIGALKASGPKAGDAITIQGRIGGKGNPFVDGYAAFLLADDTVLLACDVTDDDHCPKPWDYCCEAKSKRTKNLATIQVLGDDQKAIKANINGLDGIGAGSFIVVTGTVASNEADNLIINASGIFHDRERQIKKTASDGHGDGHDHAH